MGNVRFPPGLGPHVAALIRVNEVVETKPEHWVVRDHSYCGLPDLESEERGSRRRIPSSSDAVVRKKRDCERSGESDNGDGDAEGAATFRCRDRQGRGDKSSPSAEGKRSSQAEEHWREHC